jgi:hypothetical protein
MRHFIFVFVAVLLFSFCTWFITDRAATAQAHNAAVVVDEEHGIIHFRIDGREVARFTDGGLHVRDDIKFGGVFTDVGPEGFDDSRKGE